MATEFYAFSAFVAQGGTGADLFSLEAETRAADVGLDSKLTYSEKTPAVSPTGVTFTFDSALTGGESTALDAVVAAHLGTITNPQPNFTDESQIDHDSLNNFESNEHLDWAVAQGSNINDANIPASSVTQHTNSLYYTQSQIDIQNIILQSQVTNNTTAHNVNSGRLNVIDTDQLAQDAAIALNTAKVSADPKNSIELDSAQLQLVGDVAAPGPDQVYGTDGTGTKVWKADPVAAASFPDPKLIEADQFLNPINTDWTVNALAPLVADPTNEAISVRRFNDTTVQGMGFRMRIPTGATTIGITVHGRAQSAPTGTDNVGLDIYTRGQNDGAAIPAWSSAVALGEFTVDDTNFKEQTFSPTIASLGGSSAAGEVVTFEITRDTTPPSGNDLVGNFLLDWIEVEFS